MATVFVAQQFDVTSHVIAQVSRR